MSEEEQTPEEQLENLVHKVIDPEATFRRAAAHGLVKEFHARFDTPGLIDLLIAIDNTNTLASMIVLDRNEVDNYMYRKHGVYDDDMMMRIQLTQAWEDFAHEVIHLSGIAAAKAVNEVMNENTPIDPLL